jgi:transmembrane secretion effector
MDDPASAHAPSARQPTVAGAVAGPWAPLHSPLFPNDRAAFLQAIGRLSRIRKRDGAARWGVFEDAAEPGIYLEAFIVESWLEHLRQHARVTVADRAAEDAVGRFHRGPGRPRVRHFLAGAPAAAHSGGEPSGSPPAED